MFLPFMCCRLKADWILNMRTVHFGIVDFITTHIPFPLLLSTSLKLFSTKELRTISAAGMRPLRVLAGGTYIHCFS